MTTAAARPRDLGDILTIGFGTSAAMWLAGYLGRLPSVHAPAPLLFGVFVALLLAGGWLAGRTSQRGSRAGLWAGAVTGGINLLILGSLLGGKSGMSVPIDTMRAAALWGPSCVLISALLGWAGAFVASIKRREQPTEKPWPMHFALVTTAATLILLPLGGAVTGFEAGMAVPDWPNSFGYNMFLFPLAKMTGGVYFEHSHRLFGSLVGLTTMTLAAYLLFVDRRRSIRVIAILAFVMVVAQGLMGALRVTEINRMLGVIHGVFGQVFFVTLASLAACLSPAWRSVQSPTPHASAGTDRSLALASLAALLAQLIFGALLRHFNWGLHLHLTFAGVVFIVVGWLAIRSWGIYEGVPVVSRMGVVVLWILLLQVLLGGGALIAVWSETPGQTHPVQVLVTTAHQTTGALLLACTTVLALWHWRALRPEDASAARLNVGL